MKRRRNLPRTEPVQMAKVDLDGVRKITAKGHTYYYAWRGPGAPRLKGEPGSKEFVLSLAEALQSRNAPVVDKTRIKGLITTYKASDAWLVDMSPSTRKLWVRWLDKIDEEWGTMRVSTFRRPDFVEDIEKWRDRFKATPRAADTAMQVLSRLPVLREGSAQPLRGDRQALRQRPIGHHLDRRGSGEAREGRLQGSHVGGSARRADGPAPR